LLYAILKIYTRVVIRLFCHSIVADKKQLLQTRGPLLIAANHPNSFLDAIILDVLFDQPIWSLARGDAFKSSFSLKILPYLKMLPVYRIREGVENLENNYETFDACIQLFKSKGVVLIFSEGLCVNEWHLRSLKKGTARLAFKAWDDNIPLKVLPLGINYSSFSKFGKKVNIHFGDFITKSQFESAITDGEKYTAFNKQLKATLQPLVYEIGKNDMASIQATFGSTSLFQKILTAPLALAGALLHAPLYALARIISKLKSINKDGVHGDSITFSFLLLSYPLYLLLCSSVASIWITTPYALLIFILLPILAFCAARFDLRKG